MSKSRTGQLKPCCAWCEDNRKDLRHTITVGHTRREFCSENCLNEFKRVYLKTSAVSVPGLGISGAARHPERWPVPCARLLSAGRLCTWKTMVCCRSSVALSA